MLPIARMRGPGDVVTFPAARRLQFVVSIWVLAAVLLVPECTECFVFYHFSVLQNDRSTQVRGIY
jgi:hypothetical protein